MKNIFSGIKGVIYKQIVIPILVNLLIITVALSTGIFIVERNYKYTDLSMTAECASNEVNVVMEKTIETVKIMSQNHEIVDMFNEIEKPGDFANSENLVNVQNTLDTILDLNDNFTLVWTVDLSSGDSIRSGGVIRGLTVDDYDAKSRDWYEPSVSLSEPGFTVPYIDTTTNQICFTCITPVLSDKGEKIGLVAVDLVFDELNSIMSRYNVGKRGGFSIYDKEANLVWTNVDNQELIGKTIDETDISESVIEVVKNKNTHSEKFKLNGQNYVGYTAMVGKTGWVILAAYNRSEYYASVFITTIGSIIMIILSLGYAMYQAKKATDKIKKPMVDLREYASELENGNYLAEVSLEEGTELYDTSIHLKEMAEGLKDYRYYIEEITASLHQFADNNFNITLEHSYDGDFQTIKTAIMAFTDNMKEFVGKVQESVTTVSNESDRVSASSAELARIAAKQNENAIQIDVGVNSLMEDLNNTAEKAFAVRNLAEEEGDSLTKSKENIDELVKAINDIDEKAKAINGFVDTINSIAGQTNLLSLNASIEASRAGEHGKGFAVVATEIRTLSDDCRRASDEISKLIEATVQSVENGVKFAAKSNTIQDEVFGKATEEAVLLEQVVDLATKQRENSLKLKENIDSISKSIQMNLTNAEESNTTSQELYEQVTVLTGILSQMKIN